MSKSSNPVAGFFTNPLAFRQDNTISEEDFVQVMVWPTSSYLPAKHVTMNVVKNGENHYLSFSPLVVRGLAKRPISQIRTGVNSFFISSLEDEFLIQGLRKVWPELKLALNPAQKALIKDEPLHHFSPKEILQIAKLFDEDTQQYIKNAGHPEEMIFLHHLNTDKMVKKITKLKAQGNWLWAPAGGTNFFAHQHHTANCASIVLKVLYKGDMDRPLFFAKEVGTVLGLLVGITCACIMPVTIIGSIAIIAASVAIGRGIGAIIEGHHDIQSFIDLLKVEKKDNFPTVLGIRILSMGLSLLVGMFQKRRAIPDALTLPGNVIALAKEASMIEQDNPTGNQKITPISLRI